MQSLQRDFIFKIALGEEIDEALALQRLTYEQDIGHYPVDGMDAGAWQLVARDHEGQMVAACRIVGPNCRPFDFESQVALSSFIPESRQVALVGRFCIPAEHRRVTRDHLIHFGMLYSALALARKHGITDYVLYTYDNLVVFYKGLLFRAVTPFVHPAWGKVLLMHADLVSLAALQSSPRYPLIQRLFSTTLSNVHV